MHFDKSEWVPSRGTLFDAVIILMEERGGKRNFNSLVEIARCP
jgi:hypothetical protein